MPLPHSVFEAICESEMMTPPGVSQKMPASLLLEAVLLKIRIPVWVVLLERASLMPERSLVLNSQPSTCRAWQLSA